ncbi:MAG: cadherin-like beta sandwich domain-containing protein [Desulfobacterales bacterium]|nr:cadherin-like beta sandwich domain-containing protein [Desulfobacterales bacterium]
MDNLSKNFGILLIIALLTLLLTGCDSPPWESGMVLTLKVDTPNNGATVTTSPVVVSGRVNGSQAAGAKVTVNGADVPVKDKKFSASVPLKEGTNILNVAASSSGANLKESVTVTYTPAK